MTNETLPEAPARRVVQCRPITFSPWSIQRILARGKTHTRRLVNPQPHAVMGASGNWCLDWRVRESKGPALYGAYPWMLAPYCPYGLPGDKLWVREACGAEELAEGDPSLPPPNGPGVDGVRYFADNAFIAIENSPEAADRWGDLRHRPAPKGWETTEGAGKPMVGKVRCITLEPRDRVPAMFMPRWASRLTLRIVGVTVERVRDIDDIGAILEGCTPDGTVCPRDEYMLVWDEIYAKEPEKQWAANPWVFDINFEIIEGESRI